MMQPTCMPCQLVSLPASPLGCRMHHSLNLITTFSNLPQRPQLLASCTPSTLHPPLPPTTPYQLRCSLDWSHPAGGFMVQGESSC